MSDIVPQQAPTVREMALGNELSLFDTATGRALALNGTARDVWALVDGATTVVDIVGTLGRAYGVEAVAIDADVREALDQLAVAGVVVPTTS